MDAHPDTQLPVCHPPLLVSLMGWLAQLVERCRR